MRSLPLGAWLSAACLIHLVHLGCGGDGPGRGAGGEGGQGGQGGEDGSQESPDAAAPKGGTGGSKGPPADAAPPTSTPLDAEPTPPPADATVAADIAPTTSGLTKIFDGTKASFDENWVYNPNHWTLKEGAMVGRSTGGQSQAFTKKDYSNFRAIVWSRMVNGNDHLGICLWGGRPAAGSYGFSQCLLVIPPNGAIWDYLTNSDNPRPDYQKGMAEWHKTEILANRTTGRVQVAVNGKLVHDYMDPAAKLSRRKNGPIGMQIHKTGTDSEYKDIEIEVDPKVDRLLTVP